MSQKLGSLLIFMFAFHLGLSDHAFAATVAEISQMPIESIRELPKQDLLQLTEEQRCSVAAEDLMNDPQHLEDAKSVSQNFKQNHCVLTDGNNFLEYLRLSKCAAGNIGPLARLYRYSKNSQDHYGIEFKKCFINYPNVIPDDLKMLVYIY